MITHEIIGDDMQAVVLTMASGEEVHDSARSGTGFVPVRSVGSMRSSVL